MLIIEGIKEFKKLSIEFEETAEEAMRYGVGSVGAKALAPQLGKILHTLIILEIELYMNGVEFRSPRRSQF